jgi:hypothetical protein
MAIGIVLNNEIIRRPLSKTFRQRLDNLETPLMPVDGFVWPLDLTIARTLEPVPAAENDQFDLIKHLLFAKLSHDLSLKKAGRAASGRIDSRAPNPLGGGETPGGMGMEIIKVLNQPAPRLRPFAAQSRR